MAETRPILILGASGQVGGALLREAQRRGQRTTGTYRHAEQVGLIHWDTGMPFAPLLNEIDPGAVIYAAGFTNVDACEEREEEAILANVLVPAAIARAGRGRFRFVYFSTDYVFDGEHGPYAEAEPVCPLSAYGRSKARGEAEVLGTDPTTLVVRTTVVYGPESQGKNFATQVRRALGAGERMRVPADQISTPTYNGDLVRYTLDLLERGATGLWHVAGPELMTRAAFAQLVAEVFGLDRTLLEVVPTKALGRRAARPLRAGLRTEKLFAAFERPVMRTPREGLLAYAAAEASRGTNHAEPRDANASERLRQQIRILVSQFVQARASAEPPFVPGQSPVPYAGRVYDEAEVSAAVEACLDFWLTLGPYGERFERALASKVGVRHAVLANSGSSANLLAVSALTSPKLARPLQPGDEIITVAAGFPSTVNPIIQNGLVPVFVDILPRTYVADPGLVREAIGPRTRAIMMAHTLGNPFDLDAMLSLCQRHDLYLIEDNCDALGSTYRGRWTGSFGHLATQSFYPPHHLTMGEGGAVLTSDGKLKMIVESFRDWGRDCWCVPGKANTCGKRFEWQLGELPRGYDHKYIYTHRGYNLKPTDIQAAIGLAQLGKLDGFIQARRRHWGVLVDACKSLEEFFELPQGTPHSEPSWFGFFLLVRESAPFSREELVRALEARQIQTRMLFGGNLLRQPAYAGIRHRVLGTLAETNRVLDRGFWVGVYPGLQPAQLAFLAESLEIESKRLAGLGAPT